MRIYATTRKQGEHYHAALVQGKKVKVFSEPFVTRKTAFKHASQAANQEYNYGIKGETI